MVLRRYISSDYSLDTAAHHLGFGLADRQALDKARISAAGGRRGPEATDIVEFVQSGADLTMDGMEQFLSDKQRKEKQEIEQKQSEALDKWRIENRDFRHNTPAGNKIAAEEIAHRIANLRRDISDVLGNNEWILRKMPDGPAQVARIARACGDFIERVWPSTESDHWQIPELLQQNIGLRQALTDEHEKRIQAEAALLTGQERYRKLQERLPDVMAWSGS
jgi:hypothetical protein